MIERTTTTSAVFQRPFMLGTGEGPFPAGTYVIETEVELIPGLSFQAYRRIRTTMNVPIERGVHTALQALTIDANDLRRALEMDAASATTTK